MIEVLKQHIGLDMPAEDKINRLREALQLTALKILYDKGQFEKIAFVGGTALRFLFNLRRFSEDLDFSLIDKKKYNFQELNSQLEYGFGLYGLNVETKTREEKTVQSSFLKFSGLLKDLGLSSIDEQKLSIRIEIDSNPPQGWNIETALLNNIYLLNIVHFDLPSLYAAKLHACFFRKYTKGRDFYDLVWYLGKKINPNYALLNNTIKQTEGCELNLNEHKLKEFILERIKQIDFRLVKEDVSRFLEDREELRLLELESIKNAVIKGLGY